MSEARQQYRGGAVPATVAEGIAEIAERKPYGKRVKVPYVQREIKTVQDNQLYAAHIFDKFNVIIFI